jgi:type I restriction enzyme M protein
LDNDDHGGAAVIATATIQAGQVADEQLKRTSEHAIATAGSRRVRNGDVLITLDGEGSIGKAAVYRREYPAITDSHVGVLRPRDPKHSDAIACFINSSLGQAQIEMSISGSTGQTQLAKDAVQDLRVPICVLENSRQIGKIYVEGLKEYVPTTRQVRRILCDCEASISAIILGHSTMTQKTRQALQRLTSSDAMLTLFDRLRPSMF